MLPLGRKNARRCTECDITCHANCAHLVPDFCGMSMETANALLREAREVSRRKEEQKRRQTQGPPPQSRMSPQQPYPPPGQQAPMAMEIPQPPVEQMGGMQIGEAPQQPPMPDYGYQRGQGPIMPPPDQRLPPLAVPPFTQQPPAGPGGRPSGRPPMTPPFPTEPNARPLSGFDIQPPAPDGYPVCSYPVYSDVASACESTYICNRAGLRPHRRSNPRCRRLLLRVCHRA